MAREDAGAAWWRWVAALVATAAVAGIAFGVRQGSAGPAADAGGRPARVGEAALPPPIPGRSGHVAGIESVVVDGRRWYFAFDFGNDLVVSPLIGDPDAMARFASRHLEQRSPQRRHPPGYWRALVDDSVAHSELSAPEDDVLSGARLSGIAAALDTVARTGEEAPGFSIPGYLRYVLGAACGWCEVRGDEYAVLLTRLDAAGHEPEDVEDLAIDVVGGAAPAADAALRADAARLLRLRLDAWLDQAPGNWSEIFHALRTP